MVTMSIVLEFIYRFSAVRIKIPAGCFVDIDKRILKLMWKVKETRVAKQLWKEEEES